MDMDELTRLAVHEIALRLQRRLLSPVDLVEASLARIAAQEPRLHAYTEVYAQDARLAARAADAVIRSGHAVGPLHGVPIALKDLVELEGKLVTGGSEAWQARRAERTATLTRGLPYTDPMPTLRRGVRGLRLARMPEGEGQHASADVLAAYERSLAELERLGAEIVDVQLPSGSPTSPRSTCGSWRPRATRCTTR